MEYADPRLDEEMNVILLGNSNCYYWTDELYGMLAAEGYRNVNICNVYYSGCTFQKHWEWLRTDEAKYQFFICNERGRNVRNNVSLRTCLSYKNWDAVFLVATNSRQVYEGEEQEFEKGIRTYLPKVLEFLKERAPKADYFWQQIWAQGLGGRAKTVEDQIKASAIFRRISLGLSKDFQLTNVPQGDAWEAVRHNPLIREGGLTLNMRIAQGRADYDDHIHDGDVGGGQYLNACVFYELLTQKSCLENSFRPRYTYQGTDMSLSEEKINLLKQTAHQAVVSASEKRSAE